LLLALALTGGPPYARPSNLSHAFAKDPAPSEAFDPDVVKRTKGTSLDRALVAREAGELEQARAIALAALTNAPADEAPLLRWVAASAARALEAPVDAAKLLNELAESRHPLAPWARLQAAEWLEAAEPLRGLQLLEPLLAGSSELESFPGLRLAERARARLLASAGRKDEAIEHFEKLVGDAPDEAAAVQIAMPLADLLAERTDEASRTRALTLYRRVAFRAPDSRVGKRAEERAAEVLKQLPRDVRKALREPDVADKLARADALLSGLRYEDAEQAYLALEPHVGDDPVLRCRVTYGQARALLHRRARAEGAGRMAEAAQQCAHDTDQRAWARFQAARAFSALGRNETAIEHYEALESESPEHRLADDALFRAAKVARDMGDTEGVRRRLSALPERYPDGDMHARARFLLAWQAHAEGQIERAIELLDLPDDALEGDVEGVHGRAPYFRARWLAELGRRGEAAHGFAALFERMPLTYYGQQAFARLETLDPGRARKLLDNLRKHGPAALRFEPRPELSHPGFIRSIALLRVGELALAESELRALGLMSQATEPELYWAAVSLFERAGAPHIAVNLARARIDELLSRTPAGRDLALYRVAYPMAFEPLIEQTSDLEGVPSAFVRAVAREESGFNPRAVSPAHAYGLIQVLRPTAKAIAKGLRLPHDPEALKRPDVNLKLGVHFIRTLATNVRGQYALVPAAYNAGPSAAKRWLDARAKEPLDVWVENIPYDETRRYTRRVLQSYGVYNWLAHRELLRFPSELPAL
jgi:soluble lytic murein transglycosylase